VERQLAGQRGGEHVDALVDASPPKGLGAEQAGGLLVVDELERQLLGAWVVAGVVALVDHRDADRETGLARRTFGQAPLPRPWPRRS
jgi:hypothetical protein